MMLTNITNLSVDTTAKHASLALSENSFHMDIYSHACPARNDVEQFIKNGFKRIYGADISIAMPWLLAINKGQFKAALGIRSATSPLFIEQYLNAPIEEYLKQHQCVTTREKIAEIGHLFSNAKKFTLPLFLVTAASLFCKNFQYMTFTATEQVLSMLTSSGVNVHYLVKAEQHKLPNNHENWGTYYQTNPKVVFVSLADVMNVIESTPVYQKLFRSLDKKVVSIIQKLELFL